MITEQERWLSIGQLARRSGLTIKALRHYDRIGVLRPADVDERTGYRRYTAGQVEHAVLIRRLRALELPLDDVRRLLAHVGPDGQPSAEFTAALAEHRRRIEARATRLRGILHDLTHLLTEENVTMTTTEGTSSGTLHADAATGEAAPHKRLGVELFNATWRLLEKEDRTPADDALMIHTTHASAYHWRQVGTAANFARSEWQCSRVYAVLGHGAEAIYHARLTLGLCEDNGIGDWDLGFAYEALARAYAVSGDDDEARRWLEKARAQSEEVAEDEDRELLLSDLETIPVQARQALD